MVVEVHVVADRRPRTEVSLEEKKQANSPAEASKQVGRIRSPPAVRLPCTA